MPLLPQNVRPPLCGFPDSKLSTYIAITNPDSTTVRTPLNQYSEVSSETDHGPFSFHRTPSELRKTFLEQGWVWENYFKFLVVRHLHDKRIETERKIPRGELGPLDGISIVDFYMSDAVSGHKLHGHEEAAG